MTVIAHVLAMNGTSNHRSRSASATAFLTPSLSSRLLSTQASPFRSDTPSLPRLVLPPPSLSSGSRGRQTPTWCLLPWEKKLHVAGGFACHENLPPSSDTDVGRARSGTDAAMNAGRGRGSRRGRGGRRGGKNASLSAVGGAKKQARGGKKGTSEPPSGRFGTATQLTCVSRSQEGTRRCRRHRNLRRKSSIVRWTSTCSKISRCVWLPRDVPESRDFCSID